MDSALCNNVFTLPPWIPFLVIALIPAVAFYLRYRKFQEEMEEYRYWKNKRSEVGEEFEEVDLPDYQRFLTVEVFLALLAFGTALLGFLSTNNITYAFTVNQACIVSQAMTPVPTVPPVATLPTATPTITETPFPTQTTTSTHTPTATVAATSTPTATLTDLPTATSTSTVQPTSTSIPQRFYPLPIENGVYWPDGYNIGLTTAENTVIIQELRGIPFEVGRQINTTGCPPLPSIESNSYVLQTAIANPVAVHFLIQGGRALPVYAGDTIGRIELEFSEGIALSQDLILGFNIRDWARNKSDNEAVMTITSDMTTEAWQGPAGGVDEGSLGGMDVLTIEIPDVYRNSVIETITLEDTTLQNNGTEAPCIHLQGVTIEVSYE